MSAHNALQEAFAADKLIADPGSGKQITADRLPASVSLTSGSTGETRTIAAPLKVGDAITISLSVDGGGDVVIALGYAINAAGNTTITMNDAGDWVRLESFRIGTNLRWRVVGSDGVLLS